MSYLSWYIHKNLPNYRIARLLILLFDTSILRLQTAQHSAVTFVLVPVAGLTSSRAISDNTAFSAFGKLRKQFFRQAAIISTLVCPWRRFSDYFPDVKAVAWSTLVKEQKRSRLDTKSTFTFRGRTLQLIPTKLYMDASM
jgi:hypothetical protein